MFAFVLALVGYILCYQWIEHRRTRNGPWQVTFTRATNGEPAIVINHCSLAITNLRIHFAGVPFEPSTNTATLRFAQPQDVPYELPFGKCIFMDTSFLPGTVTLRLFSHEIELLPRTLVLDHREQPWRSGISITLPPAKVDPASELPSSQ